jgi:hypothetical protein
VGSRTEQIDRLERMGFYAYVLAEEMATVKTDALQGGYLYVLATRRSFFCDSEDLAEGGILRLLENIRPALVARGCCWSV